MKRLRAFNRTLIGLGVVVAMGCLLAGRGSAGVQDGAFSISSDGGGNVAFEVRDLSRREVLQRLLQSRGIVLEGVDPAFAEERISGAFYGSIDAVLQRLLAQTNFVAVYKHEGGTSRIARVIIAARGGEKMGGRGEVGEWLGSAGADWGGIGCRSTSGLPGPRARVEQVAALTTGDVGEGSASCSDATATRGEVGATVRRRILRVP